MKKSIFNIVILLSLCAMVLLSIWGAFLGSELAGQIAGSWYVLLPGILLAILLCLSFIKYKTLLTRPGLMMIHAGSLAVLAGGIWGGEKFHEMRMRDMPLSELGIVKYGKVYKSMIQLDEGDYVDGLYHVAPDGIKNVDSLGYKLFLKDFSLDYYENGQVKDYISEVMIIADNGHHFGPYDIEVNKPLYFGGYHFYQTDFDRVHGRYSIMRVVSDDGLWLVYAGYFLILTGIFWQLWFVPFCLWQEKSKRGGVDG